MPQTEEGLGRENTSLLSRMRFSSIKGDVFIYWLVNFIYFVNWLQFGLVTVNLFQRKIKQMGSTIM